MEKIKKYNSLLTAQSLIKYFDVPLVLTSLQSELALIPVADAIVTANWIEFKWARGTLAGSGVSVLSAYGSPLTDLWVVERLLFRKEKNRMGKK